MLRHAAALRCITATPALPRVCAQPLPLCVPFCVAGGREGYMTVLNTDVRKELDHLAVRALLPL